MSQQSTTYKSNNQPETTEDDCSSTTSESISAYSEYSNKHLDADLGWYLWAINRGASDDSGPDLTDKYEQFFAIYSDLPINQQRQISNKVGEKIGFSGKFTSCGSPSRAYYYIKEPLSDFDEEERKEYEKNLVKYIPIIYDSKQQADNDDKDDED